MIKEPARRSYTALILQDEAVPQQGGSLTKMQPMSDLPEPTQPLYWDGSYEIVLQLMALYPDTDVDALGLQELYERIVTLPNFADDPSLAHDGLLTEILREYYEEATNQ